MQELSHLQFLGFLKQRKIEIHARNGRLQISAPPGAIDPQLRAELTRRKAELLAKLPALERPSAAGDPLLHVANRGRIPQTHAQQGLWLIDHFSPGNVAYNIPEALLVDAPVDLQILQVAVDTLLARHEILRTSFYEEGGDLFQSVCPDAAAPVEYTDLSMVVEESRNSVLRNLIRQQARRQFDLRRAPLIRFHVFRLSENRHAIFFNIHHIIADRRSLTILRDELSALYAAGLKKEAAQLPELTVQYADYAIWTANRLAANGMSDQIEYWKSKLADAPAFLELSFTHPYPQQRTAWGATAPVFISHPLREAIREVGTEEAATMFMALLAAFAVLLYLNSGAEDFCIGSPFTHRNQIETESMVGLFVNMLVFRCQLNRDLNFRQFLRLVRTTALEAYENSDVPFQELVRTLKHDLRTMRSPLFQVMFGFDSQAEVRQADFEPLDTEPGTARFDLTLQLNEQPDGLSGSFEYCTDLFDAQDIERMARQFPILLERIAKQPDLPLHAFQHLPEGMNAQEATTSASHRLLDVWGGRINHFMRRLSRRS